MSWGKGTVWGHAVPQVEEATQGPALPRVEGAVEILTVRALGVGGPQVEEDCMGTQQHPHRHRGAMGGGRPHGDPPCAPERGAVMGAGGAAWGPVNAHPIKEGLCGDLPLPSPEGCCGHVKGWELEIHWDSGDPREKQRLDRDTSRWNCLGQRLAAAPEPAG